MEMFSVDFPSDLMPSLKKEKRHPQYFLDPFSQKTTQSDSTKSNKSETAKDLLLSKLK